MITELAITYPQNTIVDVIPAELPKNHDNLLNLMVKHAKTYPNGEVGGRLLTNQDYYTSTISRVRGKADRVTIPRLSHNVLGVFRAWNTQIIYHSHPLDYSLDFSEEDLSTYKDEVRHFENHLKLSHRQDGIYTLYAYVVNADGQFNTLTTAFGLTNLNPRIYTLHPTILAPERLSLSY